MMKKKNYLHLLAFAMVAMLCVGFASCGDDDDEGGSSYGKKDIVGTWQLIQQTLYNADNSVISEWNPKSYTETFNEDGTHTETDGYNSESCRWSISGDKLNYIYSGETESYKILVLDGSNMTLKYDGYSDGRYEVSTYKKISE